MVAEVSEEGVLSTKAKETAKKNDVELALAGCSVEELNAENGFGDFVAAHTAGQFKKSKTGVLRFLRVVDVEAAAVYEAADAKARKKLPLDTIVLCLDDENEYKGWMQMLQQRCKK